MTLSEELAWRGFTNQTTYKDESALDQESISFYFGVDPSSDSMTIGNLAAAMLVRHFIDHGHKAYLLVGGATGMIGDPDGKKDERNLLTLDDIAHNKEAIAEQYKTVFAGKEFNVVDNYDWFKDINYIDFLRTVGKNVPLSQMLGRDFVQSRLGSDGSGISYAEFSYSLIQGYDFVHLQREYGVSLQLCGADQWGNSIAGVDLIRRLDNKEAHVYSTPLIINKATGQKFGKSENGAVWLDSNKTSVYAFYQFWLNVDDESVYDLLKIYTLLSKEEIDKVHSESEMNLSSRKSQKTLAHEVTILVHGKERVESVERVTGVLFGNTDFASLDEDDLDILSEEIPTITINDDGPTVTTTVVNSLVESQVASSNGEARRLIESGAISVNGVKIDKDNYIVTTSLIKKGKNNFILVR
ncbi:MAG: tyrS [Candidatus Saccharibacteria bacterium]|nr:tyrS [Candidatus Saccharibacteria bacterium]